ncbi:MAG: adenylate/guanylate cyclase domain-containing protein [Saprospiraceae bacterium]|nr:adenylate/guanylate cyclase domain-containing protein [Saprospiraceae bacterium]
MLLSLLLPTATATAQTADSLAALLNTAPADTHRVTLLTDYAWEINESETDQAEAKIREALALAQKLNFKSGEATAWNGLGVVEEIRGNNTVAIAHYEKALTLRQGLRDQRGAAGVLTNIGKAYESLGKFPESLSQHRESLTIYETLKDSVRMARALINISSVLSAGGAYQEAFSEMNKARLLLENKGDMATTSRIYTQLGSNRFDLDMFLKAKEWYAKSLQLREQLGDPIDIADGLVDLGNALDELGILDSSSLAIQYYMRALRIYRKEDFKPGIGLVCNNLGDAYKHLEQFEEALQYLRESERIRLEMDDEPGLMETYNTLNDVLYRQGKIRESLAYIRRYSAIAEKIGNSNALMGAYKDFARAYVDLGDFSKAYDYQVKYNELRFKVIDEKRAQNIETQQALTSVQERQLALDRERNMAALRDAELATARTFRNALIGGAVLLLLLAVLLFNRNRLRARANRLLTTKNETIERERQRADTLLQNILPEKTAEELKTYGTVKPVHYESVTVLFSDFKNFTTIAEALSPEELVRELDEYFRCFDAIVTKHRLEKIKTIGDAYMCAGGLPEPNETHALDTVRAALEMQQTMRDLGAKKAASGKPFFEMRIGINTGPVVAGVVGSHKFAYDIWGDTVNTAARLEQGGEPGKINISETTWEKVRREFQCTFRGKLPAKNKGEIAMYFVEISSGEYPV